MEISYKREMKHNYLVIEGENQDNSYEVRMMAGNVIEGLMRFRVKRVDDSCQYCYEITSKQPLSRLLESKSLTVREVRLLFLEMSRTLNRMEEYLLKEDQVLLQPDYIYVEPELFTVEFCLLPGREGSFPAELCKLLEYLLGKVDYQDNECVVMIYGMYRESLKDNYGMEDLLKYLLCAGQQEEEGEACEEKMIPDPGESKDHRPDMRQRRYDEKEEKPKRESIGKRLCNVVKKLLGMSHDQASQDPGREDETQLPWQMVFSEEGEEACAENINTSPYAAHVSESPYRIGSMGVQQNSPESAGPNTVLLADKEKTKFHSLISLDGHVQDICIAYYPFIIGKQEGLVDYVLDDDTVSRLHLRLDEENGNCRVTDLNSTNGTEVAGTALENNESMDIKPGDEVKIAGFHFRFI